MEEKKPETMKLAVETRSTFKKEKIYGKRGDEVTIKVKKSEDLWIVENKAGDRFSISPDKLME